MCVKHLLILDYQLRMTTFKIKQLGSNQSVAEEPKEQTPSKPEELRKDNEKYKFLIWEFETPIKWMNVFFFAVWHIISVWALYNYPFWNHWGLVIYGMFFELIIFETILVYFC